MLEWEIKKKKHHLRYRFSGRGNFPSLEVEYLVVFHISSKPTTYLICPDLLMATKLWRLACACGSYSTAGSCTRANGS
jgi:hypothetical protein